MSSQQPWCKAVCGTTINVFHLAMVPVHPCGGFDSGAGDFSLRPPTVSLFTSFLLPAYDCTILVAVIFSLFVPTVPASSMVSPETVARWNTFIVVPQTALHQGC